MSDELIEFDLRMPTHISLDTCRNLEVEIDCNINTILDHQFTILTLWDQEKEL